ncbi:CaiB/BaiF CoA transferase family protein [Nakamurella leprariae]|uniref:CoA transferase n=1 Tax=Nakamurella leprariae TaxID=2803911 RepID=A0A938YDF5_9ACTN|nr:CoA transferase [Nakamurella leprariae]MBM9465708.1 CoA transferase [Nakamurella leprariae]
MARPLTGIRVLEVGQYIAAPYCAMVLADQGAEVIKVERVGVGDPRRHYDPLYVKDGRTTSGGFIGYNRNKKSVTLNLAESEGVQLFRDLADTADVIIENLHPGAMKKYGIAYDDLRTSNPGLIYCAISGYGRMDTHAGPYTDLRAFDATVQAMSGFASVVGQPGGEPTLGSAAMADIYTGVFGALAIGFALVGRATSGHGTFIDQAMYDTMVSLVERPLLLHALTGYVPKPGVDLYSPLGIIGAKDGAVSVVIPTDAMWQRFCAAIGRDDLVTDPRLATTLQRAQRFHDLIKVEAEQWTMQRTRDEVVAHFAAQGLPAGSIQTIDEVDDAEHAAAREIFFELQDPAAGPVRSVRTPLLWSDYDAARQDPPPSLGEHSDEVFLQLPGRTPAELAELRARGII